MMSRSIKESIERKIAHKKQDRKQQQQQQRKECISKQFLEINEFLDDCSVVMNENQNLTQVIKDRKGDFGNLSYRKVSDVAFIEQPQVIHKENDNMNRKPPVGSDLRQIKNHSQRQEYDEEMIWQHQIARIDYNDERSNVVYKDKNSNIVETVAADEYLCVDVASYIDLDTSSTSSVSGNNEDSEDNKGNKFNPFHDYKRNKEGKTTSKEKQSAKKLNADTSKANLKSNSNVKNLSSNKPKKVDIERNKAMLEYAIAAGYITDSNINSYDGWNELRQAVVLMLNSYKPCMDTSPTLSDSSLLPPKRPLSSYNVYFRLERRRLLLEQQLHFQQLQQQQGKSSDEVYVSHDLLDVLIRRRPPHVDYTVYDIIALNRSQDKDLGIGFPMSDTSKHTQGTSESTSSTTSTTLTTSNKTGFKRKHRKTHGMISFTQLAGAVAWRWKNEMSREQKCLFQGYFAVELDRYKKRHAAWMKQQQTLNLKIQQQQQQHQEHSDLMMGSQFSIQMEEDIYAWVHTDSYAHSDSNTIGDVDADVDAYVDADVDTNVDAIIDANVDGNYCGQTGKNICYNTSCKRVKLLSPTNNWNGHYETLFDHEAVTAPLSGKYHVNSGKQAVQTSQSNINSVISKARESMNTSTTLASNAHKPTKLQHVRFSHYPVYHSSNITNGSINSQECQESDGSQDKHQCPTVSLFKTTPITTDGTKTHCYNDTRVKKKTIPDKLSREMCMVRFMNDDDYNLDVNKDDSALEVSSHWQVPQPQKQQFCNQAQVFQQLWQQHDWSNQSFWNNSSFCGGQPQPDTLHNPSRAAYYPLNQVQQQPQLQIHPPSDQKHREELILLSSLSSNNSRNKSDRVYIGVHDSNDASFCDTETINNHNSNINQPKIPFYFEQQSPKDEQKQKETMFKTNYQQQLLQQQQTLYQQQLEQFFQEDLHRLSKHVTDTSTDKNNAANVTNPLFPTSIETPFSLSLSTHPNYSIGDTANIKSHTCLNGYQLMPQPLQCGKMQHQDYCTVTDKNVVEGQTTRRTFPDDKNERMTVLDQNSHLQNLQHFQHDKHDSFSLGLEEHSYCFPSSSQMCTMTKQKSELVPSMILALPKAIDIADMAFQSVRSSLGSPPPKSLLENNSNGIRNIQKSKTKMETSKRHYYRHFTKNDSDADNMDIVELSDITKSVTQTKERVTAVTKMGRITTAPKNSKTKELELNLRTTASSLTHSKEQQLTKLKHKMKIQKNKLQAQQKRMEQLMIMTANLDSNFIPIDNDDCFIDNSSFSMDVNCLGENDESHFSLEALTHSSDELLSKWMMDVSDTQGNLKSFRQNRKMCLSPSIDETDSDSVETINIFSDLFNTESSDLN